jgi:hypothetical protein
VVASSLEIKCIRPHKNPRAKIEKTGRILLVKT